MKSFSLFFLVALISVVVAQLISADAPDVPLCVAPSMTGNGQVNLSSIAAATYSAQLTSATVGLMPVTIHMGWCKPLNETLCASKQTGLSMAIVNTATNDCIAAFTAVTGPALPLSNTSYNFNEWAVQGQIASVTVTCDSKVPSGTAILTPNIVANYPLSQYTLNFNSSDACVSSSKKTILGGLGH